MIDQGSADDGDFRVGDRATVLMPQPTKVRIVGIATFGKLDNAGGTTETDFILPTAQRYLVGGRPEISDVLVPADEGVSQEELVRRLDRVLPSSVESITGEKLTEEQQDEIGKAFLDFFTTFLLVFAAIALIVATFSIYNTFTILVAQRTRESALLRAVGASRRQILQSVLAETFLIGLVSSVIGFFVGLLVATGLKAAFNRLGAELPTGSLVVKPATVITALVVGVLVTIVAGVFPAVRASRVPPLAAMRDVAVESTALSKPRLAIGTALTVIGLGLVLYTAFTGSGEYLLERAGLGAFLLLVGVIVLGPVVARPAAQILGAPVGRFRGVTGRLARENAMRNPRRTAGTASALLFFITVVTLFTVFFASVKASIDASVNQSFGGDLVIGPESAFGGSGISPTAAEQTAALPQVQTAVGVGGGQVEIDGNGTFATVADPGELGKIIDLDVQAGRLDRLGPDQMAVYQGTADDKDWTVGSRVPVRFVDGSTRLMRIGAIYDANDITGNYLLPRSTVAPHTPQLRDFVVLVDLKPGVSLEEGRAAVERVSDRYPGTKVQDRDQYTELDRPGHQPGAGDHRRDARPGRDHRHHRHRQHAVAVGLRANERARAPSCRGADAPPDPGDDPLGGDPRLGVRHRRRHRARRVPRLGDREGRRRGPGHRDLRGAATAAADHPPRRLARGRDRVDPPGASRRQARDPAGHRRRVRFVTRSRGARRPSRRRAVGSPDHVAARQPGADLRLGRGRRSRRPGRRAAERGAAGRAVDRYPPGRAVPPRRAAHDHARRRHRRGPRCRARAGARRGRRAAPPVPAQGPRHRRLPQRAGPSVGGPGPRGVRRGGGRRRPARRTRTAPTATRTRSPSCSWRSSTRGRSAGSASRPRR